MGYIFLGGFALVAVAILVFAILFIKVAWDSR